MIKMHWCLITALCKENNKVKMNAQHGDEKKEEEEE